MQHRYLSLLVGLGFVVGLAACSPQSNPEKQAASVSAPAPAWPDSAAAHLQRPAATLARAPRPKSLAWGPASQPLTPAATALRSPPARRAARPLRRLPGNRPVAVGATSAAVASAASAFGQVGNHLRVDNPAAAASAAAQLPGPVVGAGAAPLVQQSAAETVTSAIQSAPTSASQLAPASANQSAPLAQAS